MMETQSHIETAVGVDSEGDAHGKKGFDEESHFPESVLQKRKADDVDDESDEDEDDDDDDDDETVGEDNKILECEGPYPDDYEGSEQQEKDLKEYLRQIEESEGFDVDVFPRLSPQQGVFYAFWKVEVDNPRDGFAKNCKKAVRSAIREQNKTKGANLELVKIIKANQSGIRLFYATFEARNKTTGEANVYQTSVVLDFDGATEVHIFRLRKTRDEKVGQSLNENMNRAQGSGGVEL